MNITPPLDEETPKKLRILEIEEQREINQENIKQFIEVKKEVLNEYFIKPTRLIGGNEGPFTTRRSEGPRAHTGSSSSRLEELLNSSSISPVRKSAPTNLFA
jgi:hypothetical protein